MIISENPAFAIKIIRIYCKNVMIYTVLTYSDM